MTKWDDLKNSPFLSLSTQKLPRCSTLGLVTKASDWLKSDEISQLEP